MQFHATSKRAFLKKLQYFKPELTAAKIVGESGWDN